MNLCKSHKVCSLSRRKTGRVKLSGIYRVLLGRRQHQNIWIVDGQQVCLQLYPEFIMGGNDQRYRFNPLGEVWIDNRIGIEELEYTIAHELIERKLMRERGWSYERAHTEGGIEAERIMRARSERLAAKKGSIYRAYFGKRDGAEVWIVDGPRVRKELYADFCFATHGMKALFVPRNEIWLDSAMSVEEAGYALRQQRIERKLLGQGVSYAHAYERAQIIVLDERTAQARRAARHEHKLAPVHYGVRERGVKL